MPKRSVNLRLDDDLIMAADLLAASTGTDRTELIARGLRRELLYEGGREFVYVLLDADGEVRYVGRSRDPYQRLRQHIASAKVSGSAKEEWLAMLLAAGQSPRLAIIDDAAPGDVADCEAGWIEHFRAGGRLTNGTVADVAVAERRVKGRRQCGCIDADLLARVDAAAAARGETRRAFAERALRNELAGPEPRASNAATMAARAVPTPGRMCQTCTRNGPPRSRPCVNCGHQRGM